MKVFGDQTDNDQQVQNQEGDGEDSERLLPEQLQGKSAEEVYQALRDEHQRIMSQVKAEKYDEMTSQGKQQKGKGKEGPHPPGGRSIVEGAQPQQYRQPPPPKQEEEVDYWTNPEEFMDRQFNKRLGPLVQTQTQALRGTNKQMFMQKVGEEWEKYGDEIEQFVNALHPQLQVDPRAYQQAYNYVRSLHLDEIIEEQADSRAAQKLAEKLADQGMDQEQIANIISGSTQQQIKRQSESSSLFQSPTGVPRTGSSSSGAARQSTGPQTKRKAYSAEEKKIMEQFGMTPKEYDEYRAENTDLYSSLEGE